jgi:hypothetical protein
MLLNSPSITAPSNPNKPDLYRTPLCADCVLDSEPKVFPWPGKRGRLQTIDSRMPARLSLPIFGTPSPRAGRSRSDPKSAETVQVVTTDMALHHACGRQALRQPLLVCRHRRASSIGLGASQGGVFVSGVSSHQWAFPEPTWSNDANTSL